MLVFTGFLFNCKKLSGSNIVYLYILERSRIVSPHFCIIHLALQIPLSELRCLLLCLAVFSPHLSEQPARKPVVNDLSSCHTWLDEQWDCLPCHTECQAAATSSIPPDRCHHSSGAARRGGQSLCGCSTHVVKTGSQGTEFEHFSLNYSLHATQTWPGWAENPVCGSMWFRAGEQGFDWERPRGLQIQAAFFLELPREARQRSTALHHTAGCCVFSRPNAAAWNKKGGERLPSGMLCWCCPCSPLQQDSRMDIALHWWSQRYLYSC